MRLEINNKSVHLIIFLFLIVLGLISYDKSNFESSPEQIKPPPINVKPILPDFDRKRIPKQLLTLNTPPVYSSGQGGIKGNLYGKFLNDRAEFYIIKNSTNKIYAAKINSITLVSCQG